MNGRSRAKPFTPGKEAATTLDARTVGRDDVLRLVAGKLANVAISRNRPHTLLVGPRGAGKTHLLEVALHRARRDVADFEERVAVVRLDEDLVGVPRLIDLHREVLRGLGAVRPGPGAYLPDIIAEALGDRVLLLVVENLDRLFASLQEAGQQNFRGWVETSRQIMVLASTPLLFPGVSDRSLPWWGSFTVVHLEELTLDQGRELLVHRAEENLDTELITFLRSERGLARLKAVDALTGGSPRIWMILSDVITVELLDELVPAVEALLEGLVPYYQQLLWDLSPVEQLAVRALAEGSRQAMTVSELAAATDTNQRSLSTTLGRLVASRWLRAEKPDGLDKRLTFYRLREPMLRHHLHYRAGDDQPLPLIVEMLRAWFDRHERREHLLAAPAGTDHERAIATSYGNEPHRFDDAYVTRDLDQLAAAARAWAHGEDSLSRTPEAGALIEYAVTLVRGGVEAAHTIATARGVGVSAELRDRAVSLVDAGSDAESSVGAILDLIPQLVARPTSTVVEFIAACWSSRFDPAHARDRLGQLLDVPTLHELPLLVQDIRQEFAFLCGEAGNPAQARDLLTALLPDRERALGHDHPDSLITRHNLAHATGCAGDAAGARDLFSTLRADRERVLGHDHPTTLATRHNLALWTGQAGDATTARDLFLALLPDRTRVLGPDHPSTLTTHHDLAYWTGSAGDPARARDLLITLVRGRERTLGVNHPHTLTARGELAHWTGEAGNPLGAREMGIRVAEAARTMGDSRLYFDAEMLALRFATQAGMAAEAVERVMSLDADSLTTRQRNTLAGIALSTFVEHVAAGRLEPVDPLSSTWDLVETLRAATSGDVAARTRLPGELVAIVDEVRANRR